ncbi:MAG: LysR family transcriptional regulator [Pirellulales bacterium]
MHLKSLKIYCDVVARQSFSRAADENGISQSGASQVVHQLEQRLDVKLIDRSKRPFVLTPEGRTFYDGCREIVDRYRALMGEVRTLHDEVEGQVSVAAIYSVGLYRMNGYVQEFLSQHPKANVRLEYQHPDRVYGWVEGDQADLGLVSYPKATRRLRVIAWREEPMVLVCAPQHPLARHEAIELSQLAGYDVVAFVRGLRIRQHIDRTLAECDTEVHVAMEFDNIETVKRAVEIDAGVSLLPAATVDREVDVGTLVAVPLIDQPLNRPLGILCRRGKRLSRAAARFLELLENHADEELQVPVPDRKAATTGTKRTDKQIAHRREVAM